MKRAELVTSVVFVAMVASFVTFLTMMVGPLSEGFEQVTEDELPHQFTTEELAKLHLLRDTKLFQADGSGVKVNMPVWARREVRITNANPKEGGIRFVRTDGKRASIGVANESSAKPELFSDSVKRYFMIPDDRDLIFTHATGEKHRMTPYNTKFGAEKKGMVLYGYPRDPDTGNYHSTSYRNEQDAMVECSNNANAGGNCKGLTRYNPNGTYTLRAGNGGIQPSKLGNAETSIPMY